MKKTIAILLLIYGNSFAQNPAFINEYENWQYTTYVDHKYNELKAAAFVLNKAVKFSVLPDNDSFDVYIHLNKHNEPFSKSYFYISVTPGDSYEITSTSDNKGGFKFNVPNEFIGYLMRGNSLLIGYKSANEEYKRSFLTLKDSKEMINQAIRQSALFNMID